MIKRGLTKYLSLLLALTVIFTNFLSLGTVTSYAADGEKSDVYIVEFPRWNDANRSGWGCDALQYMNGWSTGGESKTLRLRSVGSYTGKICYCIEPGTGQHTGDTFTQKDESFWNNFPSEYNRTICGDEIKVLIGRIMQYGYAGNLSADWKTQDSAGADTLSFAIATQLLIWETIVGERDSDFTHVDTGKYDRVLDFIKENNPIRSQILNHYSDIEKSVQNHTKVPSFCERSTGKAQTLDMNWDGKQYVAVLKDENNVMSGYSFHSNVQSVSFSVKRNELTVTSPTPPTEEITVTAEKKNSLRKGLITWTDGVYAPGEASQDMVTYTQAVNDPVKAYVKLDVSYGSVKIVKTSEDGKVDGVEFRIQGGGIDKTVKTANGGKIQIDNLMPEVYTVTEQTENKYEPQEVRYITVVSGQTATVTFNNKLKRGNLTVTKTSEDGLNENIKFHLYGTSFSGLTVDEYAVTDKNGKAYFKDVLIGSDYTLEEVDTDIRYVIPKKQTADIERNKVTDKSFHNILKKCRLTVTKAGEVFSSVTETDGIYQPVYESKYLQGAVYEITAAEDIYTPDGTLRYAKGTVVSEITTDKDGKAVTEPLYLGKYEIREITAPYGTVLNSEAKTVELTYAGQDVCVAETFIEFSNERQKAEISLSKILKQDEKFKIGMNDEILSVQFGLFADEDLKAADGSVIPKDSLLEIVNCDENGNAVFSTDIPVGAKLYVKEISTDSHYFLSDKKYPIVFNYAGQDISLAEIKINDGEPIINNLIYGTVKGLKTDSETKETITGALFGLFKADETDFTEKTAILTSISDEHGIFIFENIPFGDWIVKELESAENYLLSNAAYNISVSENEQIIEITAVNDRVPETVTPPVPKIPHTSDENHIGFWIGLGSIAFGGLISIAVVCFKKKKDDDGV